MEFIVWCNCRSDLWSFGSTEVFTEQQKGPKKISKGTNYLIYIDRRAEIREVEPRKENLVIALTDYKKAYDMIPHSWIIECLDLFGVAENINSLLLNSMEKWKLILCSGNSELGEVGIKRDIFQGDSLYHILYITCNIIDSIKFDFKKG